MEMKIKSQVQFNDDLSQRSNIVSGDSLSNSFAKIHHDLNDYEIAANIAANDRPKNLLYIHDILSDSVSTATEEILGYPLEAGTYVYSAEIYTVQNPSVANVTKIEFLGADGNTVVGTCNIACDTKKEEHINVTLSDEAYYIKYYRDTYSSETVGYLKTSKQMICLPNVYAAFPEYTMYAPSLGETFLEVEDSVKTYDVQDTYNSSSYKAISGKGVAAAFGTLEVSSVGGAGQYISTISETDGKIFATPETMDTVPTSGSTKAVTSGGVQAPLAEVVDAGAKNCATINTATYTNVNRYVKIPAVCDGNSVLTMDSITSTDTNANTCGFLAEFEDGVSDALQLQRGIPIKLDFAYTKQIKSLRFFASDNYNHSGTTNTITITNLMLCTKAEWDISHEYVQYGKTNAELTQENSVQNAEISWNVNQGVKNIIDIQHPSVTKNTNYVTTSDGGVELSCSNATWTQYNIADIPVASGSEYTFIFYVDTISGTDKLQVFVRDIDSSGTTLYNSVTISTTGTYTATITPSASKIWVGIYLNNSATAKTASAKIRVMLCPAIIKDTAFQPYARSNPALTAEMDYVVNTGAKNLLDYAFSINGNTSSSTNNGVTFTINPDRSISTSGTASANITAAWIQMNYIVPSDPVILSGCPAGGSDNKYRIDILDGTPTGSVIAADYGNGVVIKSSMFTNGIGLIRIRIANGQNVDGLVFKPMIRSAEITDPTYSPYALSNPVLTPAAIKAVDEGAKNLLKNALAGISSTKYAVTASFDANGVGTISGTNNSTTNDSLFSIVESLSLPVGHYYASGCPSGGAIGTYRIDFVSSTGSVYRDTGNGVDFDITGNETIRAQFVVYRGKTAPTGTVQPMICTAADWNVSQKFVPYCPTNRELYETKATMRDVYGFGTAIPSNSNLNDYKTPGVYRIESSTVAATISNIPTGAGAARIEVKGLNAADRYLQIYYSGDVIYQRRWNGSSWFSWYKFEGTAVT